MTWYRVHFRKGQLLVDGEGELERIKARKVPKVILIEPARLHTCSICGTQGPWTDSWSWYGSYADLDDEKPTPSFCSKICASAYHERPTGRFEPNTFDPNRWRDRQAAERAANPRHFPKPKHPPERSGNGWCRWCGERVTEKNRKTWHAKCLTQFWLHTDLSAQQRHLAHRDGKHCAICGPGTGRWLDGGPMVSWQGHTGNYIKWSDDHLEVDHVVPLWSVLDLDPDDRREFFGPDNLWLLCQFHHKAKSKQEAADRAAGRKSWQ